MSLSSVDVSFVKNLVGFLGLFTSGFAEEVDEQGDEQED